MAVLSKIIAIAAAVTTVAAHPRPLPQQGGRNGGISRSIDDFQPVGFAEYVNNEESPVSTFAAEGRFNGDYEAAAEAFVAERFPGITLRKADSSYQGTNGIGHVYFRQQINGVDLDNADVNVNVSRFGDDNEDGNELTNFRLLVTALSSPSVAPSTADQLLARLPMSML